MPQSSLRNKLYNAVSHLLFKAKPGFILIPFLLVTVLCASFLPKLKFNYNIEGFFANNDPDVKFYQEYREHFENENDFILVGIKNNTGILDKDFLTRVDSLTKTLKEFSRFKKIHSPTALREFIKTPLGGNSIPLLHIQDPEQYSLDWQKITTSKIYLNSFFSPDTHAISILIKKEEHLPIAVNDSILLALNKAITSFSFDEFHVAGRIQTQHYYIHRMNKEMILFSSLAFVLFSISLVFIFRSVIYAAIPLSVVLLSLVWVFGIMGYLNIEIDLMLTLLPTLIFIIGASGSIHLLTHFKREYTSDSAKIGALKKAVKETGMPSFMNAFTASVGFASLVVIPIVPIQRFGLLSAVGILITFFIGFIIIPMVLKLTRIKPAVFDTHQQSDTINEGLFDVINKRRKIIWISYALLILFGLAFTFRVQINNYFLDDLSSSSTLKHDVTFFENNFSGIRPLEISITPKNLGTSLLDFNSLKEIEIVEKYLQTQYHAGFIFSPLSFIKTLNKGFNNGEDAYFRLPDSKEELEEILAFAYKQKVWKRFMPVLTKDKLQARLTGRTTDEGSIVWLDRNQKLNDFLKQETHLLNFKITGAAHLMDNANRNIAWNLTTGIFMSVLIDTLVIWLLVGSFRLALLSIIPNMIPLIVVSGLMGVTGIPLKVATSMIFTIAYGISVDDTMHFLNHYRLGRKINDNKPWAVKHTVDRIARPMIYTALVLVSGFMIFSFSEFSSISILGVFTGISLLVALCTNLFLVPVLLLWGEKKNMNE
ncbi:MAG: RND family transporter [Bacteroidia bacterium]